MQPWFILRSMPEYNPYTHKSFRPLYFHYNDVIMSTMASQIASLTIVHSTVYSGTDQRKHQSSASLAFVRGIHRWPLNSPHKGPVTRKMFPFDVVIIQDSLLSRHSTSVYQSIDESFLFGLLTLPIPMTLHLSRFYYKLQGHSYLVSK